MDITLKIIICIYLIGVIIFYYLNKLYEKYIGKREWDWNSVKDTIQLMWLSWIGIFLIIVVIVCIPFSRLKEKINIKLPKKPPFWL